MKKRNLPMLLDREMLDALYGFCYARCSDHTEADALCSDICYTIMRASRRNEDEEVAAPRAFLWRIAHNVYADFCESRATALETASLYDPDIVPDDLCAEEDNGTAEKLSAIFREIAFLGRAYRSVVIAYYLDGMRIAAIARQEGITENTVKQRLFAAREMLRKEAHKMNKTTNTITNTDETVALRRMDWATWGTGNPLTGEAISKCRRQLSRHVVWLCRKQARTAREISDLLHIPMTYAEEELDIQVRGENGYGMLRKTDSGKYISNVLVLDRAETAALQNVYLSRIPALCDLICDYANAHMADYLSHPYLNRAVDKNLVLWQHILSYHICVEDVVRDALQKKFADVKAADRPFTNYCFEVDPAAHLWGGGCDGVSFDHICGFEKVHLTNLYNSTLQAHFHCGGVMTKNSVNLTSDPEMLLAIRAVDGIPVSSLSEDDREAAARAIERDYIYRDGDTLYTKFLCLSYEDYKTDAWRRADDGLDSVLAPIAKEMAAELAAIIRRIIPAHLMSEYLFVNDIAGTPVTDSLIEALLARGLLMAPGQSSTAHDPEDGGHGVRTQGAEGLWMAVKQ